MDTQRPPKKPARVYGKKKQVSKSAGIFLQDSSPAPRKLGGVEIYTLHNPSGSSILKILALRPPRGPGSRRETACKVEDVLSEVAILDLVTDVGGFVVFRGVFVARGGVPAGVVRAWEGWNDKPPGADATAEESESWDEGYGRSAFPHPSKYHKDQLFLVLELGDAGKDLEHYKLTTREDLWDVFLGTTMALATGEDLFGFEHRDLHEGNICLRRAAPASRIPPSTSTSSASELRSGFSGLEITLLDYTLSRAMTEEGKTLFLDLDDPENAALFEDCEPGTKEQERKQRRGMPTLLGPEVRRVMKSAPISLANTPMRLRKPCGPKQALPALLHALTLRPRVIKDSPSIAGNPTLTKAP
ncbi:hypothetical protein VF21_10436 [Pseudogymnoascus sp. 05NY08]|nr:hypothetical protein VF21_10436 [Pseudogymnoascus sp. 05NY08]